MHNLESFSVPRDGEITICEINGRMQCMNFEFANISTFTNTTNQHPKIHITRDMLQHTGLRDEGKALFLPTDVPFLKQLTQIYVEQGFKETLKTATLHHDFLISKTSQLILRVLRQYKRIRSILSPNLSSNNVDIINELSQTRNWINNTIRSISWHPHSSRLAVVTSDDSIRIYTNDNSFVPLLRCKQQKNISCVSWRPMSLTEIAVGHENGIIIWNVDFNSLVARPSIGNATMLHRVDHNPIINLAWSPKGDFLVSVAATDSNILVWDVELNLTNILKGSREPGNVLLKWSPSKDKLLSVSYGVVFRIWDCHSWESDRWTVLSGRVQAACWSNCGRNLLFTTTSETLIYGLIVKNDQIFASDVGNSIDRAVALFDVSKLDLDGVVVGGFIQSMETDPKGSHLAVSFRETNCVAVFSVVKSPVLQLIPSSLIVGLTAEVPSSIAFQQNFKFGACLTIGWSSGRVQHFPIIYTDINNELNINQQLSPSLNQSINQTR